MIRAFANLPEVGALRVGKVLVSLSALVLAFVRLSGAGESPPTTNAERHGGIDLLHRYPTKLSAGDTVPQRARSWDFAGTDIFRLSHFRFEVDAKLKVDIGPADLGI